MKRVYHFWVYKKDKRFKDKHKLFKKDLTIAFDLITDDSEFLIFGNDGYVCIFNACRVKIIPEKTSQNWKRFFKMVEYGPCAVNIKSIQGYDIHLQRLM